MPFNQRWITHERVHLFALISLFCSCDLDLGPMTLICELDLPVDILKMNMHIKNKVSRSRLSKVRARTVQRDKCTQTHKHKHTHI